jgi:hypothetical protein
MADWLPLFLIVGFVFLLGLLNLIEYKRLD